MMSPKAKAGKMHPPRGPKKLRDIAHLFLSTSVSSRPDAGTGALVLVACDGDGPWRALAAAGLARALEAAGMDVTLLETGRRLPNAGYYFGLEPFEYLRPVLEPRACVSARVGAALHFFWARDAALLPYVPRAGATAGRPRIVLFGFDRSAGGPQGSIPQRALDLAAGAAAGPDRGSDPTTLGGNGGEGRQQRPLTAALVSAGPDQQSAYLGEVRRRFSQRFPAAPVLSLATFAGGETGGRAGNERPESAGRLCAASRRSAPAARALYTLAGALLQQLAARGET